MNNQILSKSVFDELTRHVSDFERCQNAILDDNELVPAAERKTYQQLFKQYSDHLNNLLTDAQVNDSNDNCLPFVTIGSVVELENLQNKRTNKITVIFPLANPPIQGKVTQTSYNSPMGQALFLKEPGETVEVNAPGGLFLYRIKSVILPIP